MDVGIDGPRIGDPHLRLNGGGHLRQRHAVTLELGYVFLLGPLDVIKVRPSVLYGGLELLLCALELLLSRPLGAARRF